MLNRAIISKELYEDMHNMIGLNPEEESVSLILHEIAWPSTNIDDITFYKIIVRNKYYKEDILTRLLDPSFMLKNYWFDKADNYILDVYHISQKAFLFSSDIIPTKLKPYCKFNYKYEFESNNKEDLKKLKLVIGLGNL